MTPDDIAARLRAALSGLRSHELRDIHRHLTRNLRPFLEQLDDDDPARRPATALWAEEPRIDGLPTAGHESAVIADRLDRSQAEPGIGAPGQARPDLATASRGRPERRHPERGGPDRDGPGADRPERLPSCLLRPEGARTGPVGTVRNAATRSPADLHAAARQAAERTAAGSASVGDGGADRVEVSPGESRPGTMSPSATRGRATGPKGTGRGATARDTTTRAATAQRTTARDEDSAERLSGQEVDEGGPGRLIAETVSSVSSCGRRAGGHSLTARVDAPGRVAGGAGEERRGAADERARYRRPAPLPG
ncbi:hypothetical protein FHR81_002453 [Actinoalloteichus hoggarensis]|uniref:Uncharacterized protein n=1 Tax=Actinoalloteichus hoggarensis TaxID=1470176 RepID=A0A221VX62_9PSEU|nr:hypothetical protein [Actinoalloteichus hoggarensis]ASO18057.1 hypothetical protein AHOG_01965 [Actinoalloteichus hoggarensis]MBB5921413.1 hypothetical protein [Actinoalloteichus hoggarensis]